MHLSVWIVLVSCVLPQDRRSLKCDAAIHNKREIIRSLRSTHYCIVHLLYTLYKKSTERINKIIQGKLYDMFIRQMRVLI